MATKDAGFRWTEQRRKALDLVLDGRTDKDIADLIGVHKNTVFNWRHTPEFLMETKRKMDEYATRTRLKRIRETGMITDILSGKVAKALQEDNLNKVSVYGREYHAFRSEEREDFGDNVRRVEGKFQIDGTQTVNVNAAHSVTFRQFLEANAEMIDVTGLPSAPQEAVMMLAEKALQQTDLLDQIDEEDKKVAHAAAQHNQG